MNIIIFGPPGAGKGTQAKYLVQKLNSFQISTGDMLRDEIKKDSEIGKRIINNMNDGKFVEDEIVNKLLEDLPRPEYSTIGGATLQHSASHTRPQQTNGNRQTRLGWIPQGRDVALEQAILQDLQQRMAEATIPTATPAPANNDNSTLGLPDLGL